MKKFNSRNLFDLSHEVKLTCEMGKLVPVLCEEVVPGDTFRVSTDMVVRMAPMLAPIMHNVNVYTHFFFVPNRIIFDKWEDFITGGVNGTDSTVAPTITSPSGGFATSSLADYLGVPTGVAGLKVSALPFRAYAKIYNDYYRDENLQTEVGLSTGSGSDTTTSTTLLNRCWQHDFFTNALPWTQRSTLGAVKLPLGSTAPVKGDGKVLGLTNGTTQYGLMGVATGDMAQRFTAYTGVYGANVGIQASSGSNVTANSRVGVTTDSTKSGLVADLSTATAADVNDIRYAFQVQRFLEKMARGGARYIEVIRSHFGVKSSDSRLQRPEYLGGGRSPIMISDVLQTSADDNQPTPLATMAGHGYSAQRSHQFKKFFEEHGWIIGIMSIMPRSTYQQGLEKKWTRDTRYSYYWPVFAHLGEQAIYNKEIYAQGTSADSGIFGYQPRYQEYRKSYSKVHGDFRSSLNFWHLGRIFSSLPSLNGDFVKCDPSNRIFAVTSGTDHLWIDMYHKIKALRPIPKFGDPGYIDHD